MKIEQIVASLENIKEDLAEVNLYSDIDEINVILQNLKALPDCIAPKAEDFQPLEAETVSPIINYNGIGSVENLVICTNDDSGSNNELIKLLSKIISPPLSSDNVPNL